MVSKSNFVLGIKQNISSKQRRISRTHHHQKSHMLLCWILTPRHLAATWLCAVSKPNKLKQSRDLTLQICANPCFAWWNQHHRRAPWPPAKETQKLGPQRQAQATPRAANSSGMSPRAVQNLEIQLDHSHSCRHVGLIAWRSAKPEKFGRLSRSHAPTCVACVSGSSHALPRFPHV